MGRTIKDVALEIGSGMTPLRSEARYWDIPLIPWVKTEQIGQYQIFDSKESISACAVEDTGIRLWPPHTVSVAMYGEGKTRGNVSILMMETATNQACCNIIPDPAAADYRFLYYWLKHNYEALRALAAGVRKNLNLDDIRSFPFPDLDPSAQGDIADVLSALDDKIQLNSSICAELEAMASTLYHYWFTQFDFPDGQGAPYQASGGELVWNEALRRKIPPGWAVTSLGDLCRFRNGINYNKEAKGERSCPIINVRDISASALLLDVHALDQISLPKAQAERCLASSRDIIIARSGTPGAARLLHKTDQAVIFCGFIICCSPENMEHKFYLAQLLKSLEGTSATKTGGSVLQNVSQDTLKALPLPLPPQDILSRYNDVTGSILDTIQSKMDENYELARLRDWLLSSLMNGQARVEP